MTRRVKVFMPCIGLDRIKRGLEAFTQQTFDALQDAEELDITVFKGSGPSSDKQKNIWHIPRVSSVGKLAGALIGRITRRGPYLGSLLIEQFSFFPGFASRILRDKPDLIFYSDYDLGALCWWLRKILRLKFRLLLSNGGPSPYPHNRCDLVQQITPYQYSKALEHGEAPGRHCILPYAIPMDAPQAFAPKHKETVRQQLDLPIDRKIVLSVGSIEIGHKRMDYLVTEASMLPEPRPYLVILGQVCDGTPAIVALADELLGADNYALRSVPKSQVDTYYQAADVFVLCSLMEGFGLVYVEAMANGLPCLAHDNEVTRYIFGNHGTLADFTQELQLRDNLEMTLNNPESCEQILSRQQYVYDKFSWAALRSNYVELLLASSVAD